MTDWKKVVLSEVLQEKGYIRGPFGSALKRGELLSEGIPVYEQQHAICNSRDFRFFINERKFEEMKRFQVEVDDLIISCSGTVGKVSIIEKTDPKGIISQALLLLRVNKRVILPLYLKYFFTSWEGYNAIVSRSSGSVQVNISRRNVIENIPLSLPPLDIQQKIVGVLSAIDEKIRKNTEINDNLHQQAKSIFKHMFRENASTKPATIADIALNVTDGVHNTVKDDSEGQYLLLSCKNIKGGFLNIGPFERKINSETFEKLRRRTKLEKGDILISSVGTIGEILLLNSEPSNYEFQRSVAIIKPNPEIVSSAYVYESLVAQKAELINTAHGAVQQCLFISDIAGFPIGLPSPDDLHSFDKVVMPMFDTITANEVENSTLKALRDTLLPKLMSGELDVSNLDI